MDSDWKCIYSSSRMSEIAMLQGLLEENEINCVIVNKQDSLYMIGEAELYVKTEDVLVARQIISERES